MRQRMLVLSIVLSTLPFGCDPGTMTSSDPPESTPTSSVSSSNTLYVSVQGSDQNDGSTRETAFATIGRALERIQPGETLLVLPGTYNETIRLREKGNASAPITIRGDSGRPILDGERSLPYAFQLWESRGFVFENLEIRHYTDEGIGIYLSAGIAVRSLNVHDNGFATTAPEVDGEGFGINVDECADIVIENNETHRNGPTNRNLGALGTGINTWGTTSMVIRGNHSHHNIGGGILVEDSFDVTVEDNRVDGNDLDASRFEWWDGGIWLDGGGNVLVRNNRFVNNLGPGIQISDEDRRNPTGYRLENNTSNGNYFGIYIWNFGDCPYPDDDVLTRSGNDFTGNSRRDVWCDPMPCPQGCDE